MRKRAVWIGLFVVVVVLLGLRPPGGLSADAWTVAIVTVIMATLWVSEAIPLAVTALLPLVLFPILGTADFRMVASPYADPVIFLFLGGFLLARAMEETGLHRAVALRVLARTGTRPTALLGGFLGVSAFLSMWVSNTATTLMMLPIAGSVLRVYSDLHTDTRAFRSLQTALLLAIAYGSNVGGMATLIGTAPNAMLAGYLSQTFGVDVSFVSWMKIGVPVVVVGLPMVYLVLRRRYAIGDLGSGSLTMPQTLDFRPSQLRAGIIFAGAAMLWVTRPLLMTHVPGLSDSGIALAASTLLFFVPRGGDEDRPLLSWKEAEKLPWSVLLLFGGGLSLARMIDQSGLAQWLGGQLSVLAGFPIVVLTLVVVLLVVFLTEITSNTATVATLLPIVGVIAGVAGIAPASLAIPVALAGSAAFMLPVATPPNAIVYAGGNFEIKEMARVGIILNLIFLGVVVLVTHWLI